MFQILLVTHLCTCEIRRNGAGYVEWEFSERGGGHRPGAGPTACLSNGSDM